MKSHIMSTELVRCIHPETLRGKHTIIILLQAHGSTKTDKNRAAGGNPAPLTLHPGWMMLEVEAQARDTPPLSEHAPHPNHEVYQ